MLKQCLTISSSPSPITSHEIIILEGIMEQRQYQEIAIDKVRESLLTGHKRPVMVLPTGAGKSVIFGRIISKVVDNSKTILWLVHRRNLVIQMKGTLESFFNITPGIIMSGYDTDTANQVQLCTIQTYARRMKLSETDNRFRIKADIILIDEGHRAITKQYQDVINYYKDKTIIGCTATPVRGDGRGLGEVYDDIVEIAQVKELTDQGYLAPIRYFAPVDIDLTDVKVVNGDYFIKDLSGKMVKTKLVGDIIQNWLKLSEGRKTLIYCVDVKHSKAVCEEFNKNGIAAEHLDSKSTDEEREEVFNRMERGITQVICNVALYQEGLDVPNISCIVIARPTKSLGLYRQMIGRGLRPSPGKKDLFFLDHGNTFDENGPIDWEVEWSLEGKEKAWKIKSGTKEKQAAKCRVCHEIFEGRKDCPVCGTPLKSFGKKIITVEAELAEIEGKEKFDMSTKRVWYGMFKYYAETRGYKDGWIAHKYREKFKVWPKNMDNVTPIEPTIEFRNHIKYLNIKWAKSKNNQKTQESLDRGGELVEQYKLGLQ